MKIENTAITFMTASRMRGLPADDINVLLFRSNLV
jgi:hypothetical protein